MNPEESNLIGANKGKPQTSANSQESSRIQPNPGKSRMKNLFQPLRLRVSAVPWTDPQLNVNQCELVVKNP
jgi:hypothetical protein